MCATVSAMCTVLCFTIVLPVVLPMFTYTIRPVLWVHKPNPPIMIAVTIARKVTYVKTSFRVKADQWNGKDVVRHPHANKLNLKIKNQIHEIESNLLDINVPGKTPTPVQIKNILRGKPQSINIFHFIEEINNGTAGTKRNYRKEAKRLKDYAGAALEITDIDSRFIRKYEAHERKRGMSQNTLNSTFKWLRRVLNLAVKEGLIKETPLVKEDVPKYEQSERIYLIKEERERVVQYWKEKNVEGSLYISLTYFLLGVFSGLRHGDWKHANERVVGDFLQLRATKNKEWVVLPIGPTLREILEVVKTLPPPFSGDKTRQHLKIIMGQMKMRKNITTHSARHSFGTMCAELGLPKSVAATLMGINDRTVETYYHLSGSNVMEQAAILKTL